MIERDDSRIVRVPVHKYSYPWCGYAQNFIYKFWVYDPETDSVLFYKPDRTTPEFSFPQCHGQQHIAEHLQNKLYPWAKIKQIELISVPSDD